MLRCFISQYIDKVKSSKWDSPVIYVSHYCCHPSSTMLSNQILTNPLDKVVFKYTLDNLMKQVWHHKFVNICTRKGSCKWLQVQLVREKITSLFKIEMTYENISDNPMIIPQCLCAKFVHQQLCMFMRSSHTATIQIFPIGTSIPAFVRYMQIVMTSNN